jgi:fibrillarin-like pre-rRNA processing protein
LNKIFPGVFLLRNKLATKNLVPGEKVYGEQLINIKGKEYREWKPFRSKLGAALKKGLKFFPFDFGSKVLYLGSAEGTTVSHLSDIVGREGVIYGVDLSARVMRKFIFLCEKRENLVPVLASANHPEEYARYIDGKVDVLFQDIAQKNQSEIFIKNAEAFLKKGGLGLLALKARSINPTKSAGKIFEEEKIKLKTVFRIKQSLDLKPFERDHAFFVLEKK